MDLTFKFATNQPTVEVSLYLPLLPDSPVSGELVGSLFSDCKSILSKLPTESKMYTVDAKSIARLIFSEWNKEQRLAVIGSVIVTLTVDGDDEVTQGFRWEDLSTTESA